MGLIEDVHYAVRQGWLPIFWKTAHLKLLRDQKGKEFTEIQDLQAGVSNRSCAPDGTKCGVGCKGGHKGHTQPFLRFSPLDDDYWYCLRVHHDPLLHPNTFLVESSQVFFEHNAYQGPFEKENNIEFTKQSKKQFFHKPDPEAEKKVAEKLIAWYSTQFTSSIKHGEGYRGWVRDFGYDVKGNTLFLDLQDDSNWWPLFLLAIGWSYTGQWENSSAFLGVLKDLDLLQYEKWQELGAIEILENAQMHLKKLLHSSSPFPFPWNTLPRQHRRVSFPNNWKLGMGKAIEVWPEARKLFAAAISGDISGAEFIRRFREAPLFEGLASKTVVSKARIKVKIPLILRELRTQGYNMIEAKYCAIPDSRVMDVRDRLGLYSSQDFLELVTQIGEVYGDFYDMPLFEFADYCDQLRINNCEGCPVMEFCLENLKGADSSEETHRLPHVILDKRAHHY